ncbi:MAG: helix-turn-helix domain-containing protein [Flavobacteriaceae bacterium]
MDLNINLIIDIIIIVPGVFFSLIFLFSSKSNKILLLLGLFLLSFSVERIPGIFLYLKANYYQKHLYWIITLSSLSNYLTTPLLYLFIKKVYSPTKSINHLIFIPSVVLIGIYFTFYTKTIFFEPNNYLFFILILCTTLIFNIVFLIMTYNMVVSHENQSKNNVYSLSWVKYFIYGYLILLLLQINIEFKYFDGIVVNIIDEVLNDLMIFLVLYKAFELIYIPSIARNKSKKQLDNTRAIHDFKKINNTIVNKKLYKKVDLTILELSKEMDAKIHPKRISRAINNQVNMNFNKYINCFRINEAKKMLLNDKLYDKLSIEGISKEAGFNSRSAFYKTFKKSTGTTPTDYRGILK